MTEKERQALMSIILGEHPRCTYDTLIRLEQLGYIEFVMDDLGGDWYLTNKGREYGNSD